MKKIITSAFFAIFTFASHANAATPLPQCSGGATTINYMPYVNFFMDGSDGVTLTNGAFAFQQGVINKVLDKIQDLNIVNKSVIYPATCPVSYISVAQGANFRGDFETVTNASGFTLPQNSPTNMVNPAVFGNNSPASAIYFNENTSIELLQNDVNGLVPYSGLAAPHAGFVWSVQTIGSNSPQTVHPSATNVSGDNPPAAMVVMLTPGFFESPSETNMAINFQADDICGSEYLGSYPGRNVFLTGTKFQPYLVLFDADGKQNPNFLRSCFGSGTKNTYNAQDDYSESSQEAAATAIYNAILALGNSR